MSINPSISPQNITILSNANEGGLNTIKASITKDGRSYYEVTLRVKGGQALNLDQAKEKINNIAEKVVGIAEQLDLKEDQHALIKHDPITNHEVKLYDKNNIEQAIPRENIERINNLARDFFKQLNQDRSPSSPRVAPRPSVENAPEAAAADEVELSPQEKAREKMGYITTELLETEKTQSTSLDTFLNRLNNKTEKEKKDFVKNFPGHEQEILSFLEDAKELLTDIQKTSKKLIQDLESANENPGKIAEIMTNLKAGSYKNATAISERCSELLQKIGARKQPQFNAFLDLTNQSNEPIESVMIRPAQRWPRYKMLMEDLHKTAIKAGCEEAIITRLETGGLNIKTETWKVNNADYLRGKDPNFKNLSTPERLQNAIREEFQKLKGANELNLPAEGSLIHAKLTKHIQDLEKMYNQAVLSRPLFQTAAARNAKQEYEQNLKSQIDRFKVDLAEVPPKIVFSEINLEFLTRENTNPRDERTFVLQMIEGGFNLLKAPNVKPFEQMFIQDRIEENLVAAKKLLTKLDSQTFLQKQTRSSSEREIERRLRTSVDENS